MNRIIVILIILGLGWYGNQKYRTHQQKLLSDTSENVARPESDFSSNSVQFTCDGRTHCSQMTSCEEATFFINNCPGTKMDGNHDGIPCERQWCQ
ncbi:putative calcium-binding protein [Methylomicrobium album BG8]|uniref:Putative calcium-binding protein n=1 Tax=Methylomicrobium album BG8 TaxID=686340 RepID=H8GIW1_METAL|nr:excalibur calcium-binding domain-containing protein [Methylomicrobium agile]EIC30301.1 putative calcium-binding protein [Methylomicrobium album BG8]